MVDTLEFYKSIKIDDYASLPLNAKKLVANEYGEIVGVKGYLGENLRIQYVNGFLRVRGSLAKYYKGSNIFILTHNEIKKVLDSIGSLLNVDIGDGKIIRLDMAENLNAEVEVKKYFALFGDSHYFNRFISKNTIYYNNGNRSKLFYDKTLEAKLGKEANKIIRFETRWKSKFLDSWAMKLFSKNCVQINDLKNPIIYNKIISLWEQEYRDIQKNRIFIFDTSKGANPKSIIAQFTMMGVEHMGGINKVIEMLNLSNATHPFSHSKVLPRIVKSLRETLVDDRISLESPLIISLDTQVLAKASINKVF